MVDARRLNRLAPCRARRVRIPLGAQNSIIMGILSETFERGLESEVIYSQARTIFRRHENYYLSFVNLQEEIFEQLREELTADINARIVADILKKRGCGVNG